MEQEAPHVQPKDRYVTLAEQLSTLHNLQPGDSVMLTEGVLKPDVRYFGSSADVRTLVHFGQKTIGRYRMNASEPIVVKNRTIPGFKRHILVDMYVLKDGSLVEVRKGLKYNLHFHYTDVKAEYKHETDEHGERDVLVVTRKLPGEK